MGHDQRLVPFPFCEEVVMSVDRAKALTKVEEDLARAGYIAEPSLVAALLLMQELKRPLLLEEILASVKQKLRKCSRVCCKPD